MVKCKTLLMTAFKDDLSDDKIPTVRFILISILTETWICGLKFQEMISSLKIMEWCNTNPLIHSYIHLGKACYPSDPRLWHQTDKTLEVSTSWFCDISQDTSCILISSFGKWRWFGRWRWYRYRRLGFPSGSVVKNLPPMEVTWVWSLVQGVSTCHGAS